MCNTFFESMNFFSFFTTYFFQNPQMFFNYVVFFKDWSTFFKICELFSQNPWNLCIRDFFRFSWCFSFFKMTIIILSQPLALNGPAHSFRLVGAWSPRRNQRPRAWLSGPAHERADELVRRLLPQLSRSIVSFTRKKKTLDRSW